MRINPSRRGAAGGLALAFLALHLLGVSQRRLDPMALSYAMQVSLPLLAAAVAWWNGRDRQREAATRWRLVAVAFVFWACGMSTSGCIDLGRCNADSGVDIAAYVLYGVPMLLALATSPSEWSSPLVRVIDAVMVALMTALILVSTFRLSAVAAVSGNAPLSGFINMFDVENVLLVLFAAIRLATSAGSGSHRLYGALSVYAVLYCVVAAYYNHHVVAGLGLAAGTPYDVLVGVPFLAFVLAALVPDRQAPVPPWLSSPRLLRFAVALPPFFMVITVVVVGAVAARQAFGFSITCMVLAVLGYGIRSTLQQAHHMDAARAAERDRDALAVLAWRDPLTGIGNRRAFDSALYVEWQRAQSSGRSLGLLMVDIDRFKSINDTLGHVAGDEVIGRVGRAIAASASRPGDVVARYGGEEFACLLPDTSPGDARIVAERMRVAVAGLAIAHPSSPEGRVTVSIGVASVVPAGGAAVEQLVRTADRALYAAKKAGRNRVVHGG